jgi:hypothetical protein
MRTILKSAKRIAPPSKRKKRNPFTVDYMIAIKQQLDLSTSLDAAVFACMVTCFYAIGRLGEFTVPSLKAFNPEHNIKVTDLRNDRDREGLEARVLHVPHTKVCQDGEDLCWSTQAGPTDPNAALNHHLHLNAPLPHEHLFVHIPKIGQERRPLTKSAFIRRIHEASRTAKVDPLQGHGIRIGATLEYLLRGIPFETVKVMGRWGSDAFRGYLRKHTQILAPFLQADPKLHLQFTQMVLPTAH